MDTVDLTLRLCNDPIDLTLRLWNNPIDLTLRLGLPLPDNRDQNPILDDHLSYNHNNTFLIPDTMQAMYQLAMVNQGAMVQSQEGFDGAQYALLSNHMVRNINHMNSAYTFNQISSPSIGFPSYGTNCYINIAPTGFCGHHYHLVPEMNPARMNNYTLIDVPCRRVTAPTSHEQELGIASTSTIIFHCANRGQLCQYRIRYVGPNRRCTNYNCNTSVTPMWRKGPLGPKTLCNACGIKYKNEEERKRAREASRAARAARAAARRLIRNRIIHRN